MESQQVGGASVNEMQPLVSVVIPVFNLEDYLRACVRSVLQQTMRGFEIVIIDDGSTDSSGVICDQLASEFPQVRVWHQENLGLSGARNRGVQLASADLITFVDGDDIVSPLYLERLVTPILSGEADVSSVGLVRIQSQDIRIVTSKRSPSTILLTRDSAISEMLLSRLLTVSACGKLFPKSLLLAAPFPIGRVYEDLASMPGLLKQISTVAVTPCAHYGQVERQGSITRSAEVPPTQFVDYFLALEECCRTVRSIATSEFNHEVTARRALEICRMLRLADDVRTPTVEYEETRTKVEIEFRSLWRRIVTSGSYSSSLRLKVLVRRFFPAGYGVAYRWFQRHQAKA